MEEAMSQADRVVEMKKLHDQWCRVQDALKAMSKCVCKILCPKLWSLVWRNNKFP